MQKLGSGDWGNEVSWRAETHQLLVHYELSNSIGNVSIIEELVRRRVELLQSA